MGVLPLQFKAGQSTKSLGLSSGGSVDITGLDNGNAKEVTVVATDSGKKQLIVHVMLPLARGRDFFRHGGILQYVPCQLIS